MQKTKRRIAPILILVPLLFVMITALLFLYSYYKPATEKGAKKIVVKVVTPDRSVNYTIHTDAEYLRKALEEKKLISGKESKFGLFVEKVDGITANSTLQQWWCFTKKGQSITTGVDTTPVKDGDQFEITLKTGY